MADEINTTLRSMMRSAAREGLAEVVFYAGDERLKSAVVKARGKRWEPILAIANRLGWTHAELLDKAGAVIALVENSAAAGDLAELGGKTSPVVEMVRLVISAQTAALANRERETTAAMAACTNAVQLLGEAVGTMAQIYQAAIRTAVETSAGSGVSDVERPMSSKMLEAALPHVMRKVFEDAPGPPPSPKKKEPT